MYFHRISIVLCVVLGLSAKWATAQIAPYYSPAIDLADDELKAALHNIIDGHITYPYTSGNTDVWDMLKLTDRDPDNSQNVILIYSGRSTNAAQEYNNGNGWNREHVWPSSRGGFGNSQGAGTDAHHLRPCDIQVNNLRGNRVFANCVVCTEVSSEGQPTGSFRDNTNGTFEPRDAVKGDIARMIFYMAVRYEGNGEPDLELVDAIIAENISSPLMGVLSDLLAWNAADAVDAFEMNRNEVIFGFQGNRNPFIDHPELADHLWGDLTGEAWPMSSLSSSASANAETPRAYPNPSSGRVSITGPCPIAWVSDLTGSEVLRPESKNQREVDLHDMPTGLYFIHTTHCGAEGPAVLRVLKL